MSATLAMNAGKDRLRARSSRGPLGLELRLRWGEQLLAEHFLRPHEARSFSVGSAAGADFAMGTSLLGGPRFEVVRADAEGFALRFTGRMKGELHRGDEVLELCRLAERGLSTDDGDGLAVELSPGDFLWVDLGGVTLEAFFQPVPRRVLVPLSQTVDFAVVNIFLVAFLLATLAVVGFLNSVASRDEYADELAGHPARFVKLLAEPPAPRSKAYLERLTEKTGRGEAAAPRHRGDEGSAGKPDAPKRPARAAAKGPASDDQQARALARSIFASGSGGLQAVFGPGGLSGELKTAVGNVMGLSPGDARGLGGMGLRGTETGGGGVGNTYGIGVIGTKGRGAGLKDYGGTGALPTKKAPVIVEVPTDVSVTGTLDKDLIRQVIKRNLAQIRYCYEVQLSRYPTLGGKVSVRFVISESGAVPSSKVAHSTAGNAELETCVAGKVGGWTFPRPKDGIVVVTYPFVFRQSGE